MRAVCCVLALSCVTALGGCATYDIDLRRGGVRRPALPENSPFRVAAKGPPLGSMYLGTVAMIVQARDIEDALNSLRNRVRRIGGNMVARFRCSGVVTYAVRVDYSALPGTPHLVGTKAHCKGDVYFVP